MNDDHIVIKSFTCSCIVKGAEVYVFEPSPQMCAFFGTEDRSYANGILRRIRQDISAEAADMLAQLLLDKGSRGQDFRIAYATLRAGGIPCELQLDAYADHETDQGWIYRIIGMDITELVESRKEAERLSSENKSLLDDSPVGLGIYHIRGNSFDLIYTNAEYYRVHCGSKAFWDRFKGRDALERILPEDRSVIYDEWQRTLADSGHHMYDASYRCVGEDGNIHWIRLVARMSTEDAAGLRICYASFINIDREKQAEAKVQYFKDSLIETISQLPSNSVLNRFDEDGVLRPEFYSDEFCLMLGGTQEQIHAIYDNDAFNNVVHPDDVKWLRGEVESYKGDRKPHHAVYRILTAAGVYKWVSVYYTNFSIDEKQYVYVVFNDIDELKQKERYLEQCYAEAQSYLDSLSDTYIAIMRANVSRNRVEMINGVDPIIKYAKGLSYDTVLKKMLVVMPRHRDRELFEKNFSREALIRTYESGQTVVTQDYLFIPDGGGITWARCSLHLTKHPETGDIIAFDAVSDINNIKNIEIIMNDVLIKQYDFISCIDVINNSIELVSINQQSESVKEVHGGQDYDGIMREYVKKHVVPEEREACIAFMTLSNVLKALDQQEIYTGSFMVNEGGKLLNKKLDYSYIDKESKLLTLIRTDFTSMQHKQMQQEERLRSALDMARQASIAKSEFLSRMSHEIRTPMNAIIGLDTIALQDKGISLVTEDRLKKIGISARFLLSLINDILDMSRIESGKMLLKQAEFNFHQLIDNINAIIHPQCRESGIEYECVINGFVEERYLGDETKLQQILLNILGNAVKFTPKGGKIHLMIEQIFHDQTNARLRFTIADTGRGIDATFLPHIFDTFSQEETGTTSTYGGTGLGLAISKHLVELMDGTIDVHSIKNMGTDFKVELALGLPEQSVRWNMLLPVAGGEKLKTLIVDDDVIVCQHTKIVLNEAGFNAEWVDCGAAAVSQVEQHHKADNDYDLVLVDWKMPDMDGIETARQIRKIVGPDITIIILTAYDWSDIVDRAREAGVNHFVRKPVFASTVLQAYHEARSQEQPPTEQNVTYDFSGLRLLLAEDNQINAEIARTLLEMVGFTVDVAGNGVEAIQAFTNSDPGTYSAILMDIRMPLMDGLEAAKIIRSIRKKDAATIPIIAMSANAFDEDVQKSLASGMNAHLTKPVEAQLMYETLKQLIYEAAKI